MIRKRDTIYKYINFNFFSSQLHEKLIEIRIIRLQFSLNKRIDYCMTSRSVLSSRWHYSVILDQRKIQYTLKYLQIHCGRSGDSEGATSDESRRKQKHPFYPRILSGPRTLYNKIYEATFGSFLEIRQTRYLASRLPD